MPTVIANSSNKKNNRAPEHQSTRGRFASFFFLSCTFLTLNGCIVLVPLIETDLESSAREPAAPQVISVSNVPSQQFFAQRKLSRKQRHEEFALRKLLNELNDPKPVVRINAAASLGYMGRKAESAVRPLISKLGDEHKRVRRAAAQALGRIGANEAVRPLIRTLNDRDKWVAYSAGVALRKIGTPEAMSALRTRGI